MGILTKSLVTAAAVAALYGAYSLGRDSIECPKCKAVEEAVCEYIDTDMFWESGRRAGYMEGLKAGIKEGEVIGEKAGNESGFERGRVYGYELGTNDCNARYNEGLNACDDTRYQDGMIEGEKLGLYEGRQRFYGSGTSFWNEEGGYHFVTGRRNSEGEPISLTVKINEQKCITREISINGRRNEGDVIFLEDLCINNEDADGLVDNIDQFIPRPNSSSYEEILLQRDRDFYANQELFLWADQKMKEETERFSQPVNIRL